MTFFLPAVAFVRSHWRIITPAIALLLLVLGVRYVGGMRRDLADARQAAAVAQANVVAAQDSMRVVFQDSLRTVSARLALREAPGELPVSREAVRYIERTERVPVAVLEREVIIPDLEGFDTAAVIVAENGLRSAEFSDTVPGGVLSASVQWNETMATAQLRASINPCLLVDVVTADETSAEVVTETEGRCSVRTTAPPQVDITPTISSQRWYENKWVVIGAGAVGVGIGVAVSR